MKWLRQQRRVDDLSRRVSVRARQARRFRLEVVRRSVRLARKPGTLAWAFAAGTLVGAGADRANVRRAQGLLKWINFTTMVWGFLGDKLQGTHVDLSPGGRTAASPGQ